MGNSKLHRFLSDVSGIELPTQFTYPMHYVPHELCKIAAREVMDYALRQDAWRDELLAGKMLGVLVVRTSDDSLCYLAAHSGNLGHTGEHEYFVPHIYNLLDPQGVFRKGEAEITAINHRIEALQSSPKIKDLETLRHDTIVQQLHEQSLMRQAMERSKSRRDELRLAGPLTPEQEQQLVKESQFQKAELRRLKRRHEQELERVNSLMSDMEAAIEHLKAKRKHMSEQLQRQLFSLFVVHNALGESMDVATIFERRFNRLPPGGTGDCCAPKLLQYAFLHGLKPVCMAEFWVGQSPQGEVRHHGHYYPACRSKCLPLMEFMLQGLDVESNPLAAAPSDDNIKIIYEDQWLIVIDKPAGMLTVPGKEQESTSLLEAVGTMVKDCDSLLEVHRLDQATSGLVVMARSREVQSSLRSQFERREVCKTYVALLDGTPANEKGTIDLPLRPDLDDRPRQVVDFVNGKEAVTRYRVLKHCGNRTLVEFTPLTGRTHQLRVHASHPQGLNCPIVGDMLYGTAASRLHLHAHAITFTHPVTGEVMCFKSELSPHC